MKINTALNYLKKVFLSKYHYFRTIFVKYIGDIALNIFVIVFSVYLAQYIDRKREEETKQADVKEFLLGLKTDLENDVKEMKQDEKSYRQYKLSFMRFTDETVIPFDSIFFYLNSVYGKTGLIVNNGRYEGFKTSGKMLDIKDKELLNNILDLYQENIPLLVSSTDNYSSQKDMLIEVINTHRDRHFKDKTGKDSIGKDNIGQVILLPKFYNVCAGLRYTSEIEERYDNTISLCEKIIKKINIIYNL